MKNSIIYHICTEESWKDQLDSSEYIHESLQTEGFIHCSEDHQVEGVLKRYFHGYNNLIKLTIDTSKIDNNVQYDKAPNGEKFPHIYGTLNKDAVLEINKINS